MKKLFTLCLAVVATLGAMASTTFNFTSASDMNQTKDGYTVSLSKASGNNAPAFMEDKGEMRLYAGNTISISGADITTVEVTFSKQGSKDYAGLSASSGQLTSGGVSTANTNKVTDVWTGSASQLTLTLGDKGQRIIYSLTINGDGTGGGSTPEPDQPSEPDYPSTLDPSFQYPEPTLIEVPDMTVQGADYHFVGNNVLVSATKGAVTENYFSAHAGFDMTFTATKPIKGLVINGFVKKDFEATVNHGEISYLSPSADKEADPVVVITDVNSTSVTISCVKQLRCYSVEVYFDANPDATVNGGSSGGGSIGDGTAWTFDVAEAVYESEWTEILGETNYSLYLCNAASYEWPYLCLDLYPAKEGDITGTYTMDDYSLGDATYYQWGDGEDDYYMAIDGTINITKSGNSYTVTGTIMLENYKTYTVSFTGEMDFYTDDEYYGGGEDNGVEKVEKAEETESPMYDLQGRKVKEGYKGIYIRGGKKYVGK